MAGVGRSHRPEPYPKDPAGARSEALPRNPACGAPDPRRWIASSRLRAPGRHARRPRARRPDADCGAGGHGRARTWRDRPRHGAGSHPQPRRDGIATRPGSGRRLAGGHGRRHGDPRVRRPSATTFSACTASSSSTRPRSAATAMRSSTQGATPRAISELDHCSPREAQPLLSSPTRSHHGCSSGPPCRASSGVGSAASGSGACASGRSSTRARTVRHDSRSRSTTQPAASIGWSISTRSACTDCCPRSKMSSVSNASCRNGSAR